MIRRRRWRSTREPASSPKIKKGSVSSVLTIPALSAARSVSIVSTKNSTAA